MAHGSTSQILLLGDEHSIAVWRNGSARRFSLWDRLQSFPNDVLTSVGLACLIQFEEEPVRMVEGDGQRDHRPKDDNRFFSSHRILSITLFLPSVYRSANMACCSRAGRECPRSHSPHSYLPSVPQEFWATA